MARRAPLIPGALLAVLALGACADATTAASGERLSGRLVFQATINGRPWVADSGTRSGFISVRSGQVQFAGARRSARDTVENLVVGATRFAYGAAVPISLSTGGPHSYYALILGGGAEARTFVADTGAAGFLVIDGYDPIDRLASGRFEFRARLLLEGPMGPVLGDSTITVTDGRFRLPYIGDQFVP